MGSFAFLLKASLLIKRECSSTSDLRLAWRKTHPIWSQPFEGALTSILNRLTIQR